jgi:uncharacterized protein (DUF1501 family)
MEALGMSAAGIVLKRVALPATAHAAASDPKFFLFVYFSGGWDQLLALDPRPDNDARYQRVGAAPPPSGIEPAYGRNSDDEVARILSETSGTGVQTRGSLSFGPAVPEALLAHSSDLSIIRGISMDTLTHEVGRRYLLTGKFPRGLSASGSSINTVVAAQTLAAVDIPNIAIGVESINDGLPSSSTAVRASTYRDLVTVMTPQTLIEPWPASNETALRSFEDADDTCEQREMNAAGAVSLLKSGRVDSRKLVNPAKAALFDFKFPVPTTLEGVFNDFGLAEARDLNSMRARAAVAGQALVNGVANVVSVTLADGLDDHFDLTGLQAPKLRLGFEALGRLIAFLKTKQIPSLTKSFWDCTTMVVFSEFSRTPVINSRDGRDHHQVSSALVSGPGLRGGMVFGATSESSMGPLKWNFATGGENATSGRVIRPSDVHATVLDSMGLSFSNLSNQSPAVIAALRR